MFCYVQGCHQTRDIREFRENQGILLSIKENQGKMRDFLENQGNSKFLIVSFQSSNFLNTQPCIQLSVIFAKFYPFVYHSVLCSHFEAQFRFCYKTKS